MQAFWTAAFHQLQYSATCTISGEKFNGPKHLESIKLKYVINLLNYHFSDFHHQQSYEAPVYHHGQRLDQTTTRRGVAWG